MNRPTDAERAAAEEAMYRNVSPEERAQVREQVRAKLAEAEEKRPERWRLLRERFPDLFHAA